MASKAHLVTVKEDGTTIHYTVNATGDAAAKKTVEAVQARRAAREQRETGTPTAEASSE